jgi:hypothetical protein
VHTCIGCVGSVSLCCVSILRMFADTSQKHTHTHLLIYIYPSPTLLCLSTHTHTHTHSHTYRRLPRKEAFHCRRWITTRWDHVCTPNMSSCSVFQCPTVTISSTPVPRRIWTPGSLPSSTLSPLWTSLRPLPSCMRTACAISLELSLELSSNSHQLLAKSFLHVCLLSLADPRRENK